MKKIVFLALTLLTMAACQDDDNRKVVQAETPEGVPFHFMPIYEKGVTDITITMAWPMSWAFEIDKNPAVPYVATEAILSGGTATLAPQNVMEMMNDKNSGASLYARPDHVIGEVSFPKEYINDVVPVVAEMLSTPQFHQDWIDRIKASTQANQEQYNKQSSTKMWAAARYAILGDSPVYNFLTLPDPQRIEQVDIDQLRRWHSETFTKHPVQIVVTGAISRKDAGRVIDQLLANLPNHVVTTTPKIARNFSPRTVLLHVPEAEKTILGIMGQLPSLRDGGDLHDLLALHFFARMNGPLFDAIRTELRASYGLQAGFTNYDRETRFLFITGEVETAKLAASVDVALQTYESYRSKPDFTGLDDIRSAIANGTRENVKYVDVAARTILELALDEQDTTIVPLLGDKIESTLAKDTAERMLTAFPKSSDLMIFAVSSDANALPGACVITAIEQVTACP